VRPRPRRGGEAAALDYARELDDWQGEAVVPPEEIAQAATRVPGQLKEDIGFAYGRVRDFARAQFDSMTEFEMELALGLVTGQRLIPVTTAGRYVPGGRYAYVASAIMSVTTARVAGVEKVIACSPPGRGGGVDPAILYTLDLAGADRVLALGSVQGIAALAFGLFGGQPADLLIGPGNQYVAAAKRLLYGAGRHRPLRRADRVPGDRRRDGRP
jgi:sulfopropanediol 3-dehydrogenase